MRAFGAVEEVDVDEHRLAVTRQPRRQAAGDLVEPESPIALGALRAPHLLTRAGRHEDLRIEAGGLDLGRLADLRR